MTTVALVVLGLAAWTWVYAYLVYPLLLSLMGRIRGRDFPTASPDVWPRISITVPAFNEEATIAATLDRLLECDYPADRRQLLVVSDASSDGTDDIVRRYASKGVELLRMPARGGKTAAENAARDHLTGDIIINTDASVRIKKDALKPIVAAFADPTVGVASGRDVSVARMDDTDNSGESSYVGYEMWIRGLETRVSGIVGASGCFYGIRANLHRELVPVALSRDFAAALLAREQGFRAVSVNEAVCFVPRASRLRAEYRRKVRTMARGMETLFYKRDGLHPLGDPVFLWMLLSHKICRWLAPWTAVLALLATAALAINYPIARVALGIALVVIVLSVWGWNWPEDRPMPRLLSTPTYFTTASLAAIHASIKAMRRELNPIWEPTRRKAVDSR